MVSSYMAISMVLHYHPKVWTTYTILGAVLIEQKWQERSSEKNYYSVWARALKTNKKKSPNMVNYTILGMSLDLTLITITQCHKLHLFGLFRTKDSLNRSKYLKSAFSFPGPIFFTGKESFSFSSSRERVIGHKLYAQYRT